MKKPDKQGTEMQITLNQDEIETAIKNYVNQQVNIREGQEITIDLKAGRGENGFSATIDIVPEGTPKLITKVVKTLPSDLPGPGPTPPPQTNEAAPETVQEAASEAAVPAATPVPAEEAKAADEPAAAQTEAVEEAAPEAPRKSLFGGLGKPRNDGG